MMKCDECKFAIPYRTDKYCSNGDSVKCFGVNTAFMDGCKYGEKAEDRLCGGQSNDLISREAAIAYAVSGLTRWFEGEKWIRVSEVRESLQTMTSEHPGQRWTPINRRPMTEEERKEWSEKLGYDVEYEDAFVYGNLPYEGQEVILTTTWGSVVADCFHSEGFEVYFDYIDITDAIAWMPLPEPYKDEKGQRQ